MIQTQNPQNWSKLHLKLQKVPKMSMTRHLKTKNEYKKASNQPVEIKFI
jgi:hypothetical protein